MKAVQEPQYWHSIKVVSYKYLRLSDIKMKNMNIAVLIDGDNAQASMIKETIAEVSKYGKATIKRIYGDWTTQGMNSWKKVLNENSINPIQNFTYTVGKNATDGSMIIDAMDILHSKTIDGFCLVSSDSDFTGLAKRIREEGLFVMGIGKRSTPLAFTNSCEVFTYIENLEVKSAPDIEVEKTTEADIAGTETDVTPKKTKQAPSSIGKSRMSKGDLIKIDKAFDLATNEDDGTYISKVGAILRQIDPSFDPRSFGYKNLSQLFKSLKKYTVLNNEVNGLNQPLVKIK